MTEDPPQDGPKILVPCELCRRETNHGIIADLTAAS